MATVREATGELLRARGMTAIFGAIVADDGLRLAQVPVASGMWFE